MIELNPLPPKEAIAFFEQKGFKTTFSWQDMWQEEHAKAFTVAKMASRDLLETTRAAVDKALNDGQTFEQFKKELAPKLKDAGWWGKSKMIDPQTGKEVKVQLGSNSRLKTIFQTNIRTSMAHGHWQRIERTKSAFPFLIYDAVNDNRVRPQHKAWDGICLPVDHEFWDTHFPPNDWRCRCNVRQMNQRMMDKQEVKPTSHLPHFPMKEFKNARTGEISMHEEGLHPAFAFNVGKAPLKGLSPRVTEPMPKRPIKGLSEAVLGFLNVFKAAEKARIIKDRDNWPIVIGKPMFETIQGTLATPRPDLVKLLPIVADALKHYDYAFWVWGEDKTGKAILIRRYVKRLDKETITIDFSGGTWTYRTTPNPK